MVTLGELYKCVVEEGINEDPRPRTEIEKQFKKLKEEYDALKPEEREGFDTERLSNPFDDTRILYGDHSTKVKNILIGIDIETPELLLADRLREKGQAINLVIAHHPEGKALASLHNVMSVQVHTLWQEGMPVSQAEAAVRPRMDEVRKNLHAYNHGRVPQAAEFLDCPFMCMHTASDNHVHQFLKKLLEERKPETLQDIVKILKELPEYKWAMQFNAGPSIFIGSPDSKVGKISYDMTGGTELDKSRVKKMAIAGISTIVAMHMSKDQLEECKNENMNVIVASHMASDSLGLNLLLDKIEKKFGSLNFLECSGFKRVKRN